MSIYTPALPGISDIVLGNFFPLVYFFFNKIEGKD